MTDKLTNLKKYLEKLINPSQAFEKNDFGIYLNADEFVQENDSKSQSEKFIGKIENTIFQKLDFKTTSIECKSIESGKQILTTLKDKGETIFWIKEISDYYPKIKDFKISLYYLNTYAKAFFTKQTGIRSVAYGSVFLFLNGFRIPPYGEEGDDWLKLEQRRTQGYARFISARDLVGQIEILDTNDSFKIVSSREGLVKNDNYEKLVERDGGLFYKVLRRLEKYVVDGLDWDSIPEEDKNKVAEIEKKIISGELSEEDLKYKENSETKKRRVYESIHSIIYANPKKVVELYINELSDLKINNLILKISNENSLLVNFRNLPTLCKNTKIAYHEMRDLIRYAKDKFVYIIPEIDVFSLLKNNEDMNVFYMFDEIFNLFNTTSYVHFSGQKTEFDNLAMIDSVVSFIKAKHHKKMIVYSDFINKIMDEKVIVHYYKLDDSVAHINHGRKAIYSNLEQLDFTASIKEVSLSKTYDKGISIFKLSRKAYKNIFTFYSSCYYIFHVFYQVIYCI